MVNGNQTKNVKGKKTDVIDAIWIQKLHSLGLLAASFLPNDIMQELRTYYGHRHHLIEQIARYSLKMQKSLRLVNVRLDVALRDITGKSGMTIIEAILEGNRSSVSGNPCRHKNKENKGGNCKFIAWDMEDGAII